MFKDLNVLQNLNGPLKRRIIKCPEYSRILHKSNSEFLKEDVLSPPQKIQWCDMVAEETLLVCEGRCHQLGVWTLHSPNTQDQNEAETLGGWDKVAVEEVKKLATAKARHTGEEEGEAVRRIFTKLSVILMRGNAAILANRIPAVGD